MLAEVIDERRPAGRRLQPRHRLRPGGRRGDRGAPRRRHGLVHRLDARRAGASASWPRPDVKRVALELGGKSRQRDPRRRRPASRRSPTASPSASSTPARPAPRSRGCSCRASKLAEAEAIAAAAAEQATLGDPFDEATRLGPLVSDAQRERVRGYIQQGRGGGREARRPAAPSRRRASSAATSCSPTVFSRRDARHDDRPGGDLRPGAVDHPLRRRGRGGRDRQRHDLRAGRRRLVGRRRSAPSAVARRIRTGQVEINGGAFNPLAPFGGYKQSGHGRELGRYGLEEFLEVKSIQL